MVRRKSGTGNEPTYICWLLYMLHIHSGIYKWLNQSRVTRNIFLLVCFLLFSNQWQKNPLFNAKHPFSFRSKMPEKTGSALDTAGSTRRSLLFDFIFGFVVLVARRCGFVVDFQKPFAVKSQV